MKNQDQMKKVLFSFFIIGIMMSCKEDLTPNTKNDIVGTWTPLYLQKTKDENGSWTPWRAIQTYAMLPDYVFSKNGKFSPSSECCGPSDQYKVEGNKIVFTDLNRCPDVACLVCLTWEVEWYDKDTIAIVACNNALKFARKK